MSATEAAPREPNDDGLDRDLGEFTIVGRGPARVLVLAAIAWLPAFVLSALRGQALNWAGSRSSRIWSRRCG